MGFLKSLKSSLAQARIKNKLTIITMSVCVVNAIIISVIFVLSDISSIRNQVVREVTLSANMVGGRTSSRILFMQPEKAQEDLSTLSFKESILTSCLYENNGSLYTQYKISKKYECGNPPQEYGYKFSSNLLVVHHPVKTPLGETVGSITIATDLREIYDRIRKSVLTTILVLLAVLFIAYLIVRKLQGWITDPILSLLNTTSTVGSKNNYTLRAEKHYNDEVGQLTDSFNDMMKKIQDANENLEQKVILRTRALEKEKIRAESANKAKSEFLRNMSHEFRTPLHAMNSFSLYGIKEAETAERKDLLKYFNRIQGGTVRLLSLVDGVLSLARLESGKEVFILQNNDLIKTAKSVIKEEQSLLLDKKIDVEVVEPDFSTQIVYDGNRMIQVFTNILSNAIKFTPEGKKISISFKQDDISSQEEGRKQAITFEISDEGCGIPENELSNIFGKFVQSSRTNTGAGGTGLGLSIAEGIVVGHNGEIKAMNNKNGGATFAVSIPYGLEMGKKVVKTISNNSKV